ncbi:serine/threonine-protein kinase [Actinoplanes sp. NPDC049548]|uniref:serine/threonine-protein kinase n=1 Tax=Actinoplanes sp. NPDC049548 TaxID=3155152 RepID=UPI00343D6CEA
MAVPLRPGDPRRLGGYELLARLGEGGMGTVFLGRSPGGRRVALKVVRPEYADDPEYRARFRSEVTRARQVPPFATAEVLDADPAHDPPYLVVEYVDGPSLAAVVDGQGPLTGAALHTVAVGTATALAAIHRAGVVHRDLKPDNVLLPRGGVKVIDFGVARPVEAIGHHTATDQLVGTVAYMAPERFDAHPEAGFAADVFAWGALVAYAATGRTPFHAAGPPATARCILMEPPELDGVPQPLRDIVARCLAKDPAARPAAGDLLDELVAPRPGPPVHARPASRHRARGVAIGSGALALVVAAVLAVRASTGGDAAAPDVLSGGRRVVIHLVESGEDLWIHPNGGEAETTAAAGGIAGESQFALVPSGGGHEIRWLSEEYPGQCLGVHISPGVSAVLVTSPCRPAAATVFSIRPAGRKDGAGRPAYILSNEAYGTVGRSAEDGRVTLTKSGGTSFSFVDRGPVRIS